MVDYLSDSIVKESLFIPFVYFRGVFGYLNQTRSLELDTVQRPNLSIEQWLHGGNNQFAFVDLHGHDNAQLDAINSLRMFPSILLPTDSEWTKVYDCLFFIDTMQPNILAPFSIRDEEYYGKMFGENH